MKIEIDTLALCKRLTSGGFSAKQAEALVQGLSKTDITNSYTKSEIDSMLMTLTQQTAEQCQQHSRDERIVQDSRFNAALARLDARCEQLNVGIRGHIQRCLLSGILLILTLGMALAIVHFIV